MPAFIIDANLPYYFSLWNTSEYIHLKDINERWTDQEVWQYSIENNLTIVTKDSDFSTRILLKDPPPKVIHIKIGNKKLREFYLILSNLWENVLILNKEYKLINVFETYLQGIN